MVSGTLRTIDGCDKCIPWYYQVLCKRVRLTGSYTRWPVAVAGMPVDHAVDTENRQAAEILYNNLIAHRPGILRFTQPQASPDSDLNVSNAHFKCHTSGTRKSGVYVRVRTGGCPCSSAVPKIHSQVELRKMRSKILLLPICQ